MNTRQRPQRQTHPQQQQRGLEELVANPNARRIWNFMIGKGLQPRPQVGREPRARVELEPERY